jgi:putative flippase GtrA
VNIDWAFLRLVGLYAVAVATLLYYPISHLVDAESFRSITAGGAMSIVHVLLGYLLVEWGFEKKSTTFLKVVLGGMVVRLFLMTGVVLVLLRVYSYDAFSLMISLLLYYVINLVLEIYLLQRKVSVKHQQPARQPRSGG